MGNACPHRAGAKAEASITAADVRANGWLVIFGKVYNVKLWPSTGRGGGVGVSPGAIICLPSFVLGIAQI